MQQKLSFLSSLISSFYEFVGLSSTFVRLSQRTPVCSFWATCSLWAIYTHFILMFVLPALSSSRSNRKHLRKCAAKCTISPCFSSTQSCSPVIVKQLVGPDRRDSRVVKLPLVNCFCSFILPCFASAEGVTVRVGQK